MKPSLAEQLYLHAHHSCFRRRLKKQVRFKDKYVISVGNLSAGGTGKTPTCALLLEHLYKAQKMPLVVLRGYKGSLSKKKEGALVSDGKKILHSAREVGDEAILLARSPGPRVAIGRNRSRMIELYGQEAKSIILDDAFQNPSVYRDHDLVLIDAAIPLEKMRLFPYGRMREGSEALKRAHTVLLTRFDQAPIAVSQKVREEVLSHIPESSLFYSRHKVLGLRAVDEVHLESSKEMKRDHSESAQEKTKQKLKFGKEPIGAFCGIANPQAFFHSLEELGYRLREKCAFPDHHFYGLKDLRALAKKRPRIWLSTAKDRARLEGMEKKYGKESLRDIFDSLGIELFILEIAMEILEGRQEEFLQRVSGLG